MQDANADTSQALTTSVQLYFCIMFQVRHASEFQVNKQMEDWP